MVAWASRNNAAKWNPAITAVNTYKWAFPTITSQRGVPCKQSLRFQRWTLCTGCTECSNSADANHNWLKSSHLKWVNTPGPNTNQEQLKHHYCCFRINTTELFLEKMHDFVQTDSAGGSMWGHSTGVHPRRIQHARGYFPCRLARAWHRVLGVHDILWPVEPQPRFKG